MEFLNKLEKGWVFGNAQPAKNALSNRPWMSPWAIVKAGDSLLRGIGQVCFADNPLSGLLILIGLFVGDPMAGLGAVVCSLTAIITALIFKQPDEAIGGGLTNFSAVLVGTVIASVYPIICHQPMPSVVWAYMVVGAAFSVCLLSALLAILAPTRLPPFTLPFNIATCIVFVCLRARGLVGEASQSEEEPVEEAIDWGQVFLGSFLSSGQAYAVESIVCSCLTILGLIVYSPTLTGFAVAGAIASSLTALAVSSAPYTAVYAGGWGYNGFLSGGSLAIFMVPSFRVFLLAIVNAVFTTFLHAALVPSFGLNDLPVFTFPFCISSLLFLAMAGAGGMDSARVYEPTFPERDLMLHRQALKNADKDADQSSRETASLPMTDNQAV